MDPKEQEKRALLLWNLVERFEYNEKQNVWQIKGAITPSEHDAFIEVLKQFQYSISVYKKPE